MPFVPFTKKHTTVTKEHGKPAKNLVNVPASTKKAINSTRAPKPSGSGPRGSAGYFN